VLGSEPNVFIAAFDAAVVAQKITSTTVQTALTTIGLVLTGTVETSALGNFISALSKQPPKATSPAVMYKTNCSMRSSRSSRFYDRFWSKAGSPLIEFATTLQSLGYW
jgi:hypothetical protein